MAEKILAKGLFAKPARSGAPAFVKGGLSIKVDEFIAFLNEHKNSEGWVNIDLNEKKDDASKWNGFLNEWKPTTQKGDEPAF